MHVHLLVVSICHTSLRQLLHEHVHDGRQAVRGAAGVGDHVMFRLVVLRVVHAADQGLPSKGLT